MGGSPAILVLSFRLAGNWYGVKASDVDEVLPLIEMRRPPKSPDYLAGLITFRGDIAPVVDLAMLLHDQPAKKVLSTRILLTPGIDGDHRKRLGLMVERLTESVRVAVEEVKPPVVDLKEAPYLDGLAPGPYGMIQLIDPRKVLPAEVEALFYPGED
jgi:chemotaxis-related protein WspB